MPRIDIVTVNWNGGGLIADCVRSVDDAAREGHEPIATFTVIDNASTDGSAGQLAASHLGNRFRLVSNPRNVGFAAACNQGARLGSADYILFLNPDTRLLPGALRVPVDFLDDPKNTAVGITGIQLLDADGAVARSCARFPTLGGYVAQALALDRLLPSLFPPHFMLEWAHDDTRAVDQVMGAFFFVRRDLFDRLGGFDERFFVYMEEVDFSLRASQAGASTWFLADARIVHEGQGTTKAIKATRLFYSLRSRILYGKKHFGPVKATLLTASTLTLEPIARIVHSALGGSESSVKDVSKGMWMLARAML